MHLFDKPLSATKLGYTECWGATVLRSGHPQDKAHLSSRDVSLHLTVFANSFCASDLCFNCDRPASLTQSASLPSPICHSLPLRDSHERASDLVQYTMSLPCSSTDQEENVSAPPSAPRRPTRAFLGFCLRTQNPTTTYYADSSATLCEVFSGLVDAQGLRQSTVHSTSSIERPRPTASRDPRHPADANGAVCVSDAAPAIRWRMIPQVDSSVDVHIEYPSPDTVNNECVWHRSLPISVNADRLSHSWHKRRAVVGHMVTLATEVLKSDEDARKRWEGLESGRILVRAPNDDALWYNFISADAREQLLACKTAMRTVLEA